MKNFFKSSWLIPVCLAGILCAAVATGRRTVTDNRGRPVVVYAHPPCPPELMECFRPMFAEFRRTHPGIDFRVLHITGNYEDKIKVMFAGNVAPDVIFMYPTQLPTWVELNALVPLDDFLESDSRVSPDSYFPAALDTFSYRGNRYGLPKDASADIVFYNVEMFEKYKLPRPTKDWTWTDLLNTANALTRDTDGDGRLDQWGLTTLPWWTLVRQNGGRVLDAEGRSCLLLDKRAIEALEFWAALRYQHRVVPMPEAMADMQFSALFSVGRVGMMPSMYPAAQILRKQCRFHWDIAPLPRGRRKAANATGSALAITTQCRNRKAAFEWIRWMTSPDGMRYVMSFDIPACQALGRSTEWRDPNTDPPSKQVAVDVMGYAEAIIQHPRYQEIMDELNPALDAASRGVVSVKEALEQSVPRVNAILARHERARGGR